MIQEPDTSEMTPSNRTRWTIIKVFVGEMVFLAALAVLAELALQRYAPEYGNNLYDDRHTGSYLIDSDERGFRRTFSEPCDSPLVLAAGDSVTFGTGIAWSDTWAAQLQDLLDPNKTRSACVVNTGFPATRVADISRGLRGDWSDLKPKVVVLAVTGNMISLAWIRRNEPPQVHNHPEPPQQAPNGLKERIKDLKRGAKSLCLPAFARKSGELLLYRIGLLNHKVTPEAPYGAMLAHGWRQLDLPPGRIDEAWSLFRKELTDLNDVVVSNGGVLVVTCVPSRFTMSSNLRDNAKAVPLERLTVDPVSRTADICQHLGVHFVDVREPMRLARSNSGRFDPLFVLQDYTHLDPGGNAVVAQCLATTLSRWNLLPPTTSSNPGTEPDR